MFCVFPHIINYYYANFYLQQVNQKRGIPLNQKVVQVKFGLSLWITWLYTMLADTSVGHGNCMLWKQTHFLNVFMSANHRHWFSDVHLQSPSLILWQGLHCLCEICKDSYTDTSRKCNSMVKWINLTAFGSFSSALFFQITAVLGPTHYFFKNTFTEI